MAYTADMTMTTDNTYAYYLADIASASMSALLVTPFVKIVDQTVTQKAAYDRVNIFRTAFNNIMHFVHHPIQFIKHPTFWAVFIVYSGTYAAANSISTYCESKNKDKTYLKLAGTTVTNMILGISKDKYFAKEFSKKKAAAMPMASIGLFFVRDVLTIGSGFTFPAIMSDLLIEKKYVASRSIADTISQVLVPIIAQTILTPIHILALDVYNRQGANAFSRAEKLGHLYPETVTLRMARVLGAYGIAGVTNTSFRTRMRNYISSSV